MAKLWPLKYWVVQPQSEAVSYMLDLPRQTYPGAEAARQEATRLAEMHGGIWCVLELIFAVQPVPDPPTTVSMKYPA